MTNDARRSDLTPYAAHLAANDVLDEERKFAPQTMYGLSKSGTILSSCDESRRTGNSVHKQHTRCKNVLFDGNAFYAWLLQRKAGTTRGRKIDVRALAAEFSLDDDAS